MKLNRTNEEIKSTLNNLIINIQKEFGIQPDLEMIGTMAANILGDKINDYVNQVLKDFHPTHLTKLLEELTLITHKKESQVIEKTKKKRKVENQTNKKGMH